MWMVAPDKESELVPVTWFGFILTSLLTSWVAYAIGDHNGYEKGYQDADRQANIVMSDMMMRQRARMARMRKQYLESSSPPTTNSNSENSETSSDSGSLGARILEVQRIQLSSGYGRSSVVSQSDGIASDET